MHKRGRGGRRRLLAWWSHANAGAEPVGRAMSKHKPTDLERSETLLADTSDLTWIWREPSVGSRTLFRGNARSPL
jgi:hypothetical protein